MPYIASHVLVYILQFWRHLALITLMYFPLLHASNARFSLKDIISDNPGSDPSVPNEIQSAWMAYLEKRIIELKAIFALASVLVSLSLALFQIPRATNDPFTFVFASLAQCRALSGLLYAGILFIYFETREYTRTARFAKLWWKAANESEGKIWNTWIMLSLPPASMLWAVVFYFFAILSFTLRPTTDDHTMPLSLTILLQVTIVGTTLFDLICFFCIWITWTKYREGYYAASVTVGAQV